MRAVRMISDTQFESMGLAIGQIVTMKAVIVAENKGFERSKGILTFREHETAKEN